jgi:hypothetical protein
MTYVTLSKARLEATGFFPGAGGQWYHNVTHFGNQSRAFNSDNHVHLIGKETYVGVDSRTGQGGSKALEVHEIELKFNVTMWGFDDTVVDVNPNALYRVFLEPNGLGKFTYDWQRVVFKGRKLTARQRQIADGLWTYVPDELKT